MTATTIAVLGAGLMGHGIAAIGDLGITRLAEMPALANSKIERYGEDLVLDGQLIYPGAESSTG